MHRPELIVWGGWAGVGAYSYGGRYDPIANTWSLISVAGDPAARYLHAAVWTGAEMIVRSHHRRSPGEHVAQGARSSTLV